MTGLKQVQTNCNYCGIEIRAIMSPDTYKTQRKIHWCDKIKCKIILTRKLNLDWRHYIEPNRWKEGYELIVDMENKK